MTRLAGILFVILACASTASSAEDVCAVAAHLVQADAALPRVAAAIKKKTLPIVVAGTTSSTLPGSTGPALAYPTRLEAALQQKLPGVSVKVTSFAKPRQSAAEMAAAFPKVLRDEKPALIVWQTGTADAMMGISADAFQATLEEAIGRVHEGGADVVFINPQYSPRTDAVVATAPYTEAMRWVAAGNAINLFDRQAVMREWGELGTFDLHAATKSLDTAAKVHDCIGRLLADLVLQGVAAAGDEAKDKTTR
ncbi:MAG TPA: SGNH/GDSL hydrolase family protein [Xanthobacteraceae bacterium]|nr:SGNH/GDSL hydrolase family protein [Xanthobacteraceae bacterium]